MAIKQLQKSTRKNAIEIPDKNTKVDKFIAKGGTLVANLEEKNDDHRLTLRIPCWLMEKIDARRKERVGTISRNLFIIEALDKATKK